MNKKNTLIFTATTLIVAGIVLYKKYNKNIIKSYDNNFKLSISNNWKIENSDNSTNLELVNKNTYLIMYSEKKDNNISLEEYNSHIIKEFKNNVITQDKIKLGINNAIISSFKEENINYLFYIIETKNYFNKVIIAYFNTSSININSINSMLSTLREI